MFRNGHETKRRVILFLAILLGISATVTGCRTPCVEENFARPFDSERVARLAHEAYASAYRLKFRAQHDLRFASLRPTRLDWEVVRYLDRSSWQIAWVAREVEQHPDMPRCASRGPFQNATTYLNLIRADFRPASFKPQTGAEIQNFLRKFDEISAFYEIKER